ncbi:MAG: DUF366 family protein [Candidatus Altarchaeum sp.]|nr:DUF366 family protein [Candidatus Altarchaeum sp.]
MILLKIFGNYDGSQIKPLWAKEKFGVSENNIVVMTGSMDVRFENMIDMNDLRDQKAIKTDKAIHFLIEHYDSKDIRLAYYRQRIFCITVEEILRKYNVDVERKGSDLYVKGKKLSVSIATVGKTQKIHFGINLTTKGTPADVKTIALENFKCFFDEKGLNNAKAEKFIDEILKQYIFDVEKIEMDIKKTKVFE